MPLFKSQKEIQVNGKTVVLSGPYYKFSCPYGTWTTLHRDEYFLSRQLPENERKTEFQKIFGTSSLGHIVKFHNSKDYVISQLFPRKAFKSLKKAIDFLVENEGKLVFCS